MENYRNDNNRISEYIFERITYLEEQNMSLLSQNMLLEEENLELKIMNADLNDRLLIDRKTGVRSEEYLSRLLIPRLETVLQVYNSLSSEQKETSVKHLLLVIDMNGLKVVNDSLGYEAGDKALISVANSLKQVLRANDDLVRMNSSAGDEFLLVASLPTDTSIDEAEFSITQRIKEVVKGRSAGKHTVSVGCATLEKYDSFTNAQADAVKAMQNDKNAFYQHTKSRVGKLILEDMYIQNENSL